MEKDIEVRNIHFNVEFDNKSAYSKSLEKDIEVSEIHFNAEFDEGTDIMKSYVIEEAHFEINLVQEKYWYKIKKYC